MPRVGEPTRLVAGRYATIRELGRGGMGVVWLAEDRVIGRQVALKELRTTESERVLREARTAGRLNSPNVVGIYDVIVEDGVTYLVMELVEAPTLSEVMTRKSLTEDEVADIGLQTLSALEAAHAAGIVHRDVKPSNIMVLPDGRVKLADFGIARAMDDPGLTATGGIMGSPGYMAPELFAGKQPSPASDLWALGATMFHAIEGRAPFQRDTTAATMHAIMYEEPVLQRTTGPLAATIMALLSQDDAQRITAPQLRERLSDRTRTVRPSTQSERTVVIEPVTTFVAPQTTRDDWDDEKPKSRKKIGIVAGATAAVVVIALAAVFLIKPTTPGNASAQQGPGSSEQPASQTSSTASSAPSSSSAAPSSSSQAPSSSQGPKPTQSQPNQPQPTTTQPKPPRETLVLTRYLKSGGFHYSGTSRVPAPAGFQAEAHSLGKLLAKEEPGTKPLYACRINGSEDHMTSVSPTCEGQTVLSATPLGHVFKDKPGDVPTLPLYRCIFKGTHFDSLDSKCEGYQQEWQFGWVVG
ncbi:serine/threonine protein kinase [Lentzea aerocolonigenes]|uniref:non-specific serine/threonine protein kinase n=1 Tax=Lentzea aerocolonigenes TaxID=68170 RepID=A0A0F0H7G9_LENAE|nr:serine/threonine-protein kinase [Lentzea aerocolonigenes]KJK51435.1 serine/threonine protein kinase [Lentzea aerocolonigenes]